MEENKTYNITDEQREAAARMGSLGGKKVVAKRGKKYMAKIGKRGGQNRWPQNGRQNKKSKNGK